ncbi:hypothetical protein UA08_02452 [Talaromyces atroroseus]|uniref:Mediator complex subunit 27 n=1 Tax=Talaromyces atroroseus TaxID=1441469 RepID=A0A225B8D8_TALAT|nr:hypothetical protein UA08_02452 [Talaromyces atroroseus]OKL62207.1 hypothetical protein UA08_02452 [Talaromyces atroroseus]
MSAQNPLVQQGNAAIKLEESSLQQQLQSIDWDSERQLISSLSKLQELESKIHELRSLLPDRLLAPLTPIVNPRRSSSSNPVPQSPHTLNALLRKSATEGVAEVTNFKDLWLSPDMQAVWSRVDQKLIETNGAYPQPSGTWNRDYDALLKQMDEQEGNGARVQAQPDIERGQQPNSTLLPIYGTADPEREAGWKSVVESFQKRQIAGFRLASSKNESMIYVNLGLAGIIFEIQEVLTTNNAAASDTSTTTSSTPGAGTRQPLPEWHVSTRQSLGKNGPSRLEMAIVQQLNSRPRKWDLHYLLSQPCKKCNKLTDSSAQLPVIRKLATTTAPSMNTTSTSNEAAIAWEAYHAECA